MVAKKLVVDSKQIEKPNLCSDKLFKNMFKWTVNKWLIE